jgi:YD repeat-containing protein
MERVRVHRLMWAALVLIAVVARPAQGQGPITFRYFYDDAGQLQKVVDSTGVVLEYVYDAVGNIVEIKRSTTAPGGLAIFSFTPGQGGPLTSVTIRGQGFASTPAGNIVRFNGAAAAVLSAAPDTLVAIVPVGATSGPISVTVAENAATSATNFSIISGPVITSITPNVVDATRSASALQVAGVNLTGATFALLPVLEPSPITIGTPTVNQGGTAATLPITVAPNVRGRFTLVGTNASGTSDAFPSNGNTLWVINAQDDADSDDDGFPDGLEVLFGSDPFDPASVPDLMANGDLLSGAVSVANTLITSATPQELFSAAVSVANTLLTSAAPQDLLSPAVSVSNTLVTSTTPQELISPAVSVANSSLGGTTQALVSAAVSILNSSPLITEEAPMSLLQGATTNPLLADARELSVTLYRTGDVAGVVEGQTIGIQAIVSGTPTLATVEFAVNGEPLGVDSTPLYELTFTVPSGVPNLAFTATVTDSAGNQATAAPLSVAVQSDGHTTITGRVVDGDGNPVEGAVVDLLSPGLEAEFFNFVQPLAALPDLSGRTPDRVTRVTALNLRNPGGVFGFDPLGSDLAPDYAVRFTGWIEVTTAGKHQFFLGAHEGARLKIGDSTVVDLSTSKGVYQEDSGAVDLTPGQIPIEVTYYEGAGNSELQLTYIPPGGERQVVSPSQLVPGWQPFVTATDALGMFTVRDVPTALDVVQIRATVKQGSQTIGAISMRIAPVPTTAVDIGDIIIVMPPR